MSERETATGGLGLVQTFVNTLDMVPRNEELNDPNTLKAWLVARDLMDPSQPVDEADLKHAHAVREAMRAVIGGNSGYRIYPVELATLNEAASASKLRMRFGPEGRARLEPQASGAWERLKLCSSDECRWAFYDRSKNHSSRWCTMASCGNREKARRFRAQKKLPSGRLHRHA